MKAFTFQLFLWSQCCFITPTQAAIRFLTSQTLFRGMEEGRFDVVGDVRSAADYEEGHIPNVTHVELLYLAGRASERATPADLAGCEYCHIVLYSSDGNRAQEALQILQDAGFVNLYNGLGVNQWALAGYPLVTLADNIVPPCTTNQAVSDQCETKHLAAPTVPVSAPVRAPSAVFSPSVPIKKDVSRDPLKDALKLAFASDISRGSLNRRGRQVRGDLN